MSLRFLNIVQMKLHKINRVFYRYHSIDISTPLVQRYLNYLVLQTEALLYKDQRDWSEIIKLRKIQPIANIITQKMALNTSIQSLNQQFQQEEDDYDKDTLRNEVQIYQKRAIEIDDQIKNALLEPYLSEGEVMLQLEVKEGDHAALFVKELVDMYRLYARHKLWDFHVVSQDDVDFGITKASLLIRGLGVPELMSVENGVHLKVAARPKVISGDDSMPNRINMVAVSVLAVPVKLEFNISPEELNLETKVIQDPVNKKITHTSICVTHKASNTTVECNKSKSLEVNKEVAIKKLKTILFHAAKETVTSGKEKKQEMPSEEMKPFRTYDVGQDRVMEHRNSPNNQYRLATFLSDGHVLESLQTCVLRQWHYENLLKDIRKFKNEYPLETD